MWHRYTESARKVIFHAQGHAVRLNLAGVGPELLLLGILDEAVASGTSLSNASEVLAELRSLVERAAGLGNLKPLTAGKTAILNPEAKQAIAYASERCVGSLIDPQPSETKAPPSISTVDLLEGVRRQWEENRPLEARCYEALLDAFDILTASLLPTSATGNLRDQHPLGPLSKLLEGHSRQVTDGLKDTALVAERMAKEGRFVEVQPAHWLLAILADRKSGAYRILEGIGVGIDVLCELIDKTLGTEERSPTGKLSISTPTLRLWNRSYDVARFTGVGSEHVLMALVSDPESSLGDLIRRVGVTRVAVASLMRDAPLNDEEDFVEAREPLGTQPEDPSRWGLDDLVLCMLLADEDQLGSPNLNLPELPTKALEYKLRAAVGKNRKLRVSAAAERSRLVTALLQRALVLAAQSGQEFHVGHAVMACFSEPSSVTYQVLSNLGYGASDLAVCLGLDPS